jgi:hypothetical protein
LLCLILLLDLPSSDLRQGSIAEQCCKLFDDLFFPRTILAYIRWQILDIAWLSLRKESAGAFSPD